MLLPRRRPWVSHTSHGISGTTAPLPRSLCRTGTCMQISFSRCLLFTPEFATDRLFVHVVIYATQGCCTQPHLALPAVCTSSLQLTWRQGSLSKTANLRTPHKHSMWMYRATATILTQRGQQAHAGLTPIPTFTAACVQTAKAC